ncbi:hypothetical protein FPQ18DRAFT_105369 [Pyronema domesticum]|uniref:Similar to UPF0658 Golgi apparatus membrane protein C23H3.04 acc. no. O13938 n=1 Tax=Pyronema omphalodes (strain CBS 100304) TaxID=1076935 RepID=U4LRS9_PYROM|nr:hypothetical protein FPQ18DRAFT_105369 [Pyronema domesticum]CCX32040.1 Similar to UPF0658 Golgi apparatus membrane protein C23H3.04; acc. no. O13938 [Pyronema omphalodes CBS 100304]
MIYRPSTPWSWSFLILAFVQSCIVLACEGYVFATFQSNLILPNIMSLQSNATTDADTTAKIEFQRAQTRTIPTYLTLFIFAHMFLVILCYDALRLKNTIQVIGICVFNLAMLIYAAIQMDQIKDANWALGEAGDNGMPLRKKDIWNDIRPFLITIPCVIALSTILMSVVCWKLYDEFAWRIYKHISADLRMKKRYLTFQIFIALLKFDFFFFVGFTVQFIVIVASTTGFATNPSDRIGGRDYEFYVTIAALPITIAFLILAAWCTRREKRAIMWGVVVVFFAALAYFVFKLVRMWQKDYEQNYKPARRSLTTFAVITILLICLTIGNAVACILNFGKGLKPHITKRRVSDEEDKNSMTEMSNHVSPVPARMTID